MAVKASIAGIKWVFVSRRDLVDKIQMKCELHEEQRIDDRPS
jgi:hypothetical protein